MLAPDKKQPRLSPSGSQPLIPDKFLDIPSQRLYYLSLGLLCQAIKIVDFSWYLVNGDEGNTNCRKWLFVDFAYCVILTRLRIPRLTYSKTVVLIQIALLWFLDGLMFGGISLNLPYRSSDPGTLSTSNSRVLSTTTESATFLDYIAPFTFGLLAAAGPRDAHLVGQHTVRMSPISTAQLNPDSLPFCLSPPSNFVLIPVLLNNTTPAELKFSLTTLGHDVPEIYELTAKDLKAIEQERLAVLRASRPLSSARDSDEYDEYDDDDDVTHESESFLQSTQSLVHIRITRPGTLRLESLLDQSRVPVRISHPSTVNVVPCPTVEFIDKELVEDNVRCSGQDPDLELVIRVYGVPPLSLRWLKTINGRREHFLVEGIENNSASKESPSKIRQGISEEMKIPLSIALDTPGTYVYALEEVADSVGNVVRIGPDASADFSGLVQTRTTRSLVVLRRAKVSFQSCGPGSPTSLLIGSEASLGISVNDAEEFDSPWEISLKYEPFPDGDKQNRRHRSWNKTLKTQGHPGDLNARVSVPGEYAIIGVQGKRCLGDILSPETCRVIEKPLPTAEIEWKQIHECSGDTGVSASLVLRGTPPFQVFYRIQRDDESPRDQSKTFSNSRGELTLQPERSGHYTFTFTHLSDTYYKKVELKGPSIDQVIHPLAAADFVASQGGNRRRISSCDGDIVSVDVELRGTGPWNLEMQVVGPESSETIRLEGIETPRKSILVPIPKGINSDEDTFDINIVSIEDVYKCKRAVSVPGITVSVRGVKATARFYSIGGKRSTTVLEHESASLPLRLTGDAPWRLKYRHLDDNKVLTRTLNNPNEELLVTQKGTFEILDIADSRCPGMVITEASTFEVNWVPRPSAKLSLETKSRYEPHNSSHILPPVCEGTADYVDLDLTGRPPFEIMYNIGQNDNGGTKIIDQPTFNSIQPRTRFQLRTSHHGRMYYEVKQIGDADYPLAKHRNAVIPRGDRLLFEQEIFMRPSARFKNRNRMSYCLNDQFTPLDALSTDGTVLLEGMPPFSLRLSIKNSICLRTCSDPLDPTLSLSSRFKTP
ncbi:putative nucleoporin [Termitomyces sp. T112]|nr:putative nucleoporin [Termitomyces sp. T112]